MNVYTKGSKLHRLLAAHRRKHPKSRAESIIRYHLNTNSRKQRQCVLCENVGPSWSAQWPKTKAAVRWEEAHEAWHAKHGVGEPTKTVTIAHESYGLRQTFRSVLGAQNAIRECGPEFRDVWLHERTDGTVVDERNQVVGRVTYAAR